MTSTLKVWPTPKPEAIKIKYYRGNNFSVAWETETSRYHVWMDCPGVLAQDRKIYRNPLVFTERYTPAHFDTQMRDIDAKANSATKEVLQAIPAKAFAAAQAKKSEISARDQTENVRILREQAKKYGFKLVPLNEA